MKTYLILQHPGHNRVYYTAAGLLALAELKIASNSLSIRCNNIQMLDIQGVRYLSFTADESVADSDLELLSRLSFVFALYELTSQEEVDLLKPILKVNYEYVDSKISSLLKYSGKTNELFTKMMINVALLSSEFRFSETIELLDPIVGKGTTLFEGAVYGFNVSGVEIEPKSTHAVQIFFKKYLETERYKYSFNRQQVHGKNKLEGTFGDMFQYASNKEDFKTEVTRKTLNVVTGSTLNTSKYFKHNHFNIIVGDLPYGIAHGNSLAKKSDSITRNPSELLNECLPDWLKVLKTGGVIVMAWNAFVVNRNKLSKVFLEHGFQVLSDAPYNEFEHLVDRSIKRDIIVAKKIG
jgi:hypothetical protein